MKHAERQGRSAYVSRAGSARPAAPVQPRGTLGRGDRRHLEISKNATNVDNSLYSILLCRTPAGGRAPPPSAIGPTPPPRSQRAPSALPRHSAEIDDARGSRGAPGTTDRPSEKRVSPAAPTERRGAGRGPPPVIAGAPASPRSGDHQRQQSAARRAQRRRPPGTWPRGVLLLRSLNPTIHRATPALGRCGRGEGPRRLGHQPHRRALGGATARRAGGRARA